jgi:hypothetical protein
MPRLSPLPAGRAKVAPPVVADDIARKGEVDAVQTGLNGHLADNAIHVTSTERNTWNNVISIIDNLKINALLTNLQLSANSRNIDAWCDILDNTSMINTSLSSEYVLSGSKLTATRSMNQLMKSKDFNYFFFDNGSYIRKYVAQVIKTTTSTSKLNSITVCICLGGKTPPDGGVTCKLYSTSGGVPLAVIAASTTIIPYSSINSIASDGLEFTFMFNPINLTPNTQYAFVLSSITETMGNVYNYAVAHDNGTSSYSGGKAYNFTGSTWTQYSNSLYFKISIIDTVGTVIWNKQISTTPLSKIAITSSLAYNTGSISWYLSNNGTNWISVPNLNTMIQTNFTTTDVYLKCVLTNDSEIYSVAFGG